MILKEDPRVMARTLELTSVALAGMVERLTRRIQQLHKLHSRVHSEAAPTRSDFVWIDESPLMDPECVPLWPLQEYYDSQMKDDLSHPSSPVPDDPLALVSIHHVIASADYEQGSQFINIIPMDGSAIVGLAILGLEDGCRVTGQSYGMNYSSELGRYLQGHPELAEMSQFTCFKPLSSEQIAMGWAQGTTHVKCLEHVIDQGICLLALGTGNFEKFGSDCNLLNKLWVLVPKLGCFDEAQPLLRQIGSALTEPSYQDIPAALQEYLNQVMATVEGDIISMSSIIDLPTHHKGLELIKATKRGSSTGYKHVTYDSRDSGFYFIRYHDYGQSLPLSKFGLKHAKFPRTGAGLLEAAHRVTPHSHHVVCQHNNGCV